MARRKHDNAIMNPAGLADRSSDQPVEQIGAFAFSAL